MRIFCISDLHIDFEENYQWVSNISACEYQDDILIIAGDVTNDRLRLKRAFKLLTRRFKHLFFVPGNHDLWVFDQGNKSSFEAFYEVERIATDHGLITAPRTFGNTCIIPMLGWYDYSFGAPSQALCNSWVDFRACQWPSNFNESDITRFFVEQNNNPLPSNQISIITFSHFLPRIDLIPKFVPAKVRLLFPVLGTRLLETQLRRFNSQTHIYGHSHLNRDVTLEGVRYINNAFGYPYETRISAKKLFFIGNA